MSQHSREPSSTEQTNDTGPYDDVIPQGSDDQHSQGRRSISPGQGRNKDANQRRILKNRDQEESSAVQETPQIEQEVHTRRPSEQRDSSRQSQHEPTTAKAETGESGGSNKHRVAIELPEAHRNALDDIKLHLRREEKLSPRRTSYHSIMIEALERYYAELFPGEHIS